jgi:hypothetical protein
MSMAQPLLEPIEIGPTNDNFTPQKPLYSFKAIAASPLVEDQPYIGNLRNRDFFNKRNPDHGNKHRSLVRNGIAYGPQYNAGLSLVKPDIDSFN